MARISSPLQPRNRVSALSLPRKHRTCSGQGRFRVFPEALSPSRESMCHRPQTPLHSTLRASTYSTARNLTSRTQSFFKCQRSTRHLLLDRLLSSRHQSLQTCLLPRKTTGKRQRSLSSLPRLSVQVPGSHRISRPPAPRRRPSCPHGWHQ